MQKGDQSAHARRRRGQAGGRACVGACVRARVWRGRGCCCGGCDRGCVCTCKCTARPAAARALPAERGPKQFAGWWGQQQRRGARVGPAGVEGAPGRSGPAGGFLSRKGAAAGSSGQGIGRQSADRAPPAGRPQGERRRRRALAARRRRWRWRAGAAARRARMGTLESRVGFLGKDFRWHRRSPRTGERGDVGAGAERNGAPNARTCVRGWPGSGGSPAPASPLPRAPPALPTIRPRAIHHSTGAARWRGGVRVKRGRVRHARACPSRAGSTEPGNQSGLCQPDRRGSTILARGQPNWSTHWIAMGLRTE